MISVTQRRIASSGVAATSNDDSYLVFVFVLVETPPTQAILGESETKTQAK